GCEGGEPEQSQAGNEDGDNHKYAEHFALPLVGLIQLAKIVIQEVTPDSLGRREGVPLPVHESQRLRHRIGPDADKRISWIFWVININRGLGRLPRAVELGIGENTD